MNVSRRSTTALPKSGCFRQRSMKTPATMRCGRNPTVKVFTRSAFFASEYASQMTSASFGHLGGLDVHRADREPARRAAAGVPEAHDAEQEQDADDAEHRVREPVERW